MRKAFFCEEKIMKIFLLYREIAAILYSRYNEEIAAMKYACSYLKSELNKCLNSFQLNAVSYGSICTLAFNS